MRPLRTIRESTRADCRFSENKQQIAAERSILSCKVLVRSMHPLPLTSNRRSLTGRKDRPVSRRPWFGQARGINFAIASMACAQ